MCREPLCEVSLKELARMIRHDMVAEHNTTATRQLLQQGDRQGADEVKRSGHAIMPGAYVAGGRTLEDVVAYTGLAMCDIDGIGDTATRNQVAALLRDDPHVAMLWITHKGMGLRVLFCGDRVPEDNDEYNRLWQVGNDHFEQLTGLPVDRQTRGANHLSQVPHDPDVLLRAEAMPFSIPSAPPKSVPNVGWVEHEQDPLSVAQRFVEQNGVWYAEGHHNEFVSRMAYQMNRLGVDSSEAARLLVQAGFVDGNAKITEGIVRNVYRNHGGEHGSLAYMLAPRKKRGPGRPRKYPKQTKATTDDNRSDDEGNRHTTKTEMVIQYLSNHYHCRYNTVTGVAELCPLDSESDRYIAVDDIMLNTISNNICMEYGANISEQLVRRVLYSEASEQYNPFVAYLEQLPEWDGTDHVGRLADRVKTSVPRLFVHYLTRFLVKMVRSLLGLDVNQDMLILAGPQRIGKSTFAATLLPPELRQYFDTMGAIQFVDKDVRMKLSRYALISIEEYSGLNGKTAELAKGLMRQTVINERRAYGVVESHYCRYASFVATTNESHLLVDPTGNETLYPFWVEHIVYAEGPHATDYRGLYSQLYHMATDPDYSDRDLSEMRDEYEQYRHQFDAVCAEQELIASHYRLPTEEDRLLGRVALLYASEITAFVNLQNRSNLSAAKVGAALSQMGYPFVSRHNKRRYQVVPLDIDTINAQKQADTEQIRHDAMLRSNRNEDDNLNENSKL